MATNVMNEKKVLKVNPNDFLVSSAGKRSSTRKKAPSTEPKEPKKIQMRDNVPKTVKKQLMKHLREQQKLNYEKLLACGGVDLTGGNDSAGDFGETVQSMIALMTPPSAAPPVAPSKIPSSIGNKQTFKRHHHTANPSITAYMTPAPITSITPKVSPPLFSSSMPEAIPFMPEANHLMPEAIPFMPEANRLMPEANHLMPEAIPFMPEAIPFMPEAIPFMPEAIPSSMGVPSIGVPSIGCDSNIHTNIGSTPNTTNILKSQNPQWGCLKNGQLPTYRKFHQHTMKRPEPKLELEPVSNNPFLGICGAREELMKQMSEKYQMGNIQHRISSGTDVPQKYRLPKYKKQRKITRRTYRLGKSKVFPRVSVLVPNKTARKEVTDAIHAIQETPIHEVRSYLVKNGFIKIGSSAPNDVLRRMYENLRFMNGDIKNHNTETLLHNYLQSEES
jgi:hypothetical protein